MKSLLGWAAFWIVTAFFYVSYFGRGAVDTGQVLRLALPLLVVAWSTEMAIGGVLLPRFLLRGKRGQFLLYSAYTVVVSVWSVLGITVGEFMMSGYRIAAMSPAALDRAGLLVGVYIVVAVALSIRLVGHWDSLRRELLQTERTLEATLDPPPLEIQVDRRTVRLDLESIQFLESAGDYVLVHTRDGKLMTKARLGALADQLIPAGFLRVHRSFVVRRGAIDSTSASTLVVGGTEIPVSRSFRAAVKASLGGDGDSPFVS